jgi:hypothetical protein
VLDVAVFAAGTGELGVNVQIGDEHGGLTIPVGTDIRAGVAQLTATLRAEAGASFALGRIG